MFTPYKVIGHYMPKTKDPRRILNTLRKKVIEAGFKPTPGTAFSAADYNTFDRDCELRTTPLNERSNSRNWHQDGGPAACQLYPLIVGWSDQFSTELKWFDPATGKELRFQAEPGEIVMFHNTQCTHRCPAEADQKSDRMFFRAYVKPESE